MNGPQSNRRLAAFPSRIIRSFGFAFMGLGYLFRTQRNARIELASAIIVCALAAWLRVDPISWAILILTIGSVLAAEALNTAIEAVVDLASPKLHPVAKIAKDVSAGMVLIVAIGAIGVGWFVLGIPLCERLRGM
jgi:diacylglycerol kinase